MNQRIRSIKPEMWNDEKVRRMAPAVKLFFVQLITFVDDDGRFRADLGGLASFTDPDGLEDDPAAAMAAVKGCLRALADVGMVTLYEVGGCRYGALVNWHKHQKIDKRTPSKLPAPDGLASDSRGGREEVARTSRPDLDQDHGSGSLPPTPLAGGDAGEGEQSEGYYSAKGGNVPARVATPAQRAKAVPVSAPEESPAAQAIERFRLMKGGLMVSPGEAQAIRDMLDKYGTLHMDAALTRLDEAFERKTVANLRRALDGHPKAQRVEQATPPRPPEPPIPMSEEDRARRAAMLQAGSLQLANLGRRGGAELNS